MFFFDSFLSSSHFLFHSSKMFWYTPVFTLTDYISKQKRGIENDKTPEVVYLLRVINKDTTGIIESCSKWKYMMLFLCIRTSVTNYQHVFITNFEHFLHEKRWQWLSLDINISMKYVYFRKHNIRTKIMFFECNENQGVRV